MPPAPRLLRLTPGPTRATRVLMVEDDPARARAARAWLESAPMGPWVVDRRETADEALAALLAGGYDVCLVDHGALGTRVLDVLRAARARGVRVPAVLVSDRPVDMRSAGVSACVTRSLANADTLADALSLALGRAA